MGDDQKHLDQRIDEIVSTVVTAREDGTFTLAEAGTIAMQCAEAATHVAQAMGDYQGHFSELVAASENVFDKYVVAIDWPGIPEFIERGVESFVRSQIRGAIQKAYEVLGTAG